MRLEVLSKGSAAPAGVAVGDDTNPNGHLDHSLALGALSYGPPGVSGRTETSDISASPEFSNRAFVLSIPESESSSSNPSVLRCQLWCSSTETSSEKSGISQSGDSLVAYGDVPLGGESGQRLSRGEVVTMGLALKAGSGPTAASNIATLSLSLQMLEAQLVGGVGVEANGSGLKMSTIQVH